ncbi:MAG TPA: NlpC/P60 family protein [Chthoniobacterales bacterium]|nr:NlpC/P60 family protein [Chthoniobacterales bacterium]
MPWKRIVLLLPAAALGLLIIVPYRNSLIRLVLLALWGLTGLSLVAVTWRKKALRVLLMLMIAAFFAALLIPGREKINTDRLRQRFVDHLSQYDGVRYVYGGENHRGIDCSGLVRAAMVRALADESLAAGDPALLRAALQLWWRDTNAIQLGKGANGLTLPIADGAAIPMRAAQSLRAGDLAVTTSGSHVLACLGASRWIEADPDIMRVHIVDLNSSPIAGQEVLMVAWRWLR